MLFSKKAFCIAALSALAAFGYSGSANAISFKLTTGVDGGYADGSHGAFSEFYQNKDTTTVDFQNGAPTTGFAQYSFQHDQPGATTNASSVRADMWAPSGAEGQNNTSKYLAVYNGDAVTINLQSNLNYFGIDWGAISENNTFSFYEGDKLIQSFTSADVEPLAEKNGVLNAAQNQYNGYLHFYSDSNQDNFNKIIISQSSPVGGGFENGNHSFHQGTGAFDFKTGQSSVPEPGMALGLVAVGGMLLRQRKNQKFRLPN